MRGIDYPRKAREGWTRFLLSWRQVLSLVLLGFTLLLAAFATAYALISVPDPNPDFSKAATIVYYADGKTEIGRFADINREPVPLVQVPSYVQKAVLSAEDRSFYENDGVSPRGIARALISNLRGGSKQGGSTITQQYVKNVRLNSERTLSRKLKEFVIAIKVDKQLSKDTILDDYLNAIYWGRNANGIESASQAWFNKPASKLTVSEGAFLAGIINSPSRYEPSVHLADATRRWNYVLDGMVTKGWLSPSLRGSQVFPVVRPRSTQQRLGGTNGYLLDEVKRELLQKGFDQDQIDAGGLRVTTTFDLKAQNAAVKAVTGEFPKVNNARVRVGLASIKPGDGAVVAMYGGPDFLAQQVNAASRELQLIGSTIKPLTLVAALQNGRNLKSKYDGNSPLQIPGDKPVRNENGQDYGAQIDLYKALQQSVNTAFVALTLDIHADKVFAAAKAAGLDTGTVGLEPNARITLGTSATSPLVLANSYATIDAGGTRVQPYVVRLVKGANGGTLYKAKPVKRENVFGTDSAKITADVTDAMAQVIQKGTGTAALALGRPAAGKTGTAALEAPDPDQPGRVKSYNITAWFSGFTPELSTTVLYFRTGDTVQQRSLDGVGEANPAKNATFFGAGYPTKTWTAYMKEALAGQPVKTFPKPAHLGQTTTPSVTVSPTTTSPSPTTVSPSTSSAPPSSSTPPPSSPSPSPSSPSPSSGSPSPSSGSPSPGSSSPSPGSSSPSPSSPSPSAVISPPPPTGTRQKR